MRVKGGCLSERTQFENQSHQDQIVPDGLIQGLELEVQHSLHTAGTGHLWHLSFYSSKDAIL